MTNKELGTFIKRRRLELGYSLKKVAAYCDVNSSTVMRWEDGYISKIKRYHLYMLSKILCVPVGTLLSGGIDESDLCSPQVVLKREAIKTMVDKVTSLDDLERISKIISTFM